MKWKSAVGVPIAVVLVVVGVWVGKALVLAGVLALVLAGVAGGAVALVLARAGAVVLARVVVGAVALVLAGVLALVLAGVAGGEMALMLARVLARVLTDVAGAAVSAVGGVAIMPLLAPAIIGVFIWILFHIPKHERTFFDYYYEGINAIKHPDDSVHTESTGLLIVAGVFSVPLAIIMLVSSVIVDVFASDSLVWSALASIISAVTIGSIDRLIIDDGNE